MREVINTLTPPTKSTLEWAIKSDRRHNSALVAALHILGDNIKTVAHAHADSTDRSN